MIACCYSGTCLFHDIVWTDMVRNTICTNRKLCEQTNIDVESIKLTVGTAIFKTVSTIAYYLFDLLFASISRKTLWRKWLTLNRLLVLLFYDQTSHCNNFLDLSCTSYIFITNCTEKMTPRMPMCKANFQTMRCKHKLCTGRH